MQGSELEKVERKQAELEFSIREKETIFQQDYYQITNKLQNTEQDLISMESDLKLIGQLLEQEEMVTRENKQCKRRLDNYYNRIVLPFDSETKADEQLYSNLIDESIKTIAV